MTSITGACYRSSAKDRTFKAQENLLNEVRYQESVKRIEEVVA